MDLKKKTVIYLILFAVIDVIIPIPLMAMLLLYVVFEKPPWFINLVSEVYKSVD